MPSVDSTAFSRISRSLSSSASGRWRLRNRGCRWWRSRCRDGPSAEFISPPQPQPFASSNSHETHPYSHGGLRRIAVSGVLVGYTAYISRNFSHQFRTLSRDIRKSRRFIRILSHFCRKLPGTLGRLRSFTEDFRGLSGCFRRTSECFRGTTENFRQLSEDFRTSCEDFRNPAENFRKLSESFRTGCGLLRKCSR